MIDRRKFVALLSSLPLIDKTTLVVCQKPLVPPGYVRCAVCNEYNGTTDASNLSWGDRSRPTGEISVTCLCHEETAEISVVFPQGVSHRNTVPEVHGNADPPAHFKYVLPGLKPDRALAVLRRPEPLLRVPRKNATFEKMAP